MSSKSGGRKKSKDEPGRTVIADNRKARFNYEIIDTFEAGLVLEGTEVKSLREGKASIAESYASEHMGEMYIYNMDIPVYKQAGQNNHKPKRVRKLLLNLKEISKLMGGIQKEGLTLVPLKLYFNTRGIAKCELALARGKKLHDKRQTDKDRSWAKDKARLMREKG